MHDRAFLIVVLGWLFIAAQLLVLLNYAWRVSKYKKSKVVVGEVIAKDLKNYYHREFKNNYKVYQAVITVKYQLMGKVWTSSQSILRMEWLFSRTAGQDFDFEYEISKKYQIGDSVNLKVIEGLPEKPLLATAPFKSLFLMVFYVITGLFGVFTYCWLNDVWF